MKYRLTSAALLTSAFLLLTCLPARAIDNVNINDPKPITLTTGSHALPVILYSPAGVYVPAGGAGGGGDFTIATFNAAFGTAGTADSQVLSVQGISGGTAQPVSIASVPSHAVTNAGTFATQITTQVAAANYANGQVTTSTTAGTLKAANATRRSIVVKNTDTAITVYIGAATVTAANGMPLKPGESIPIDSTALIQVIAASGTPVVAYMETYD